MKIQEEKSSSYVLGLNFNSESDTSHFSVLELDKEIAIKEASKRLEASIAFRLYDHLGFLSPFTVKIRLLIQCLWSLGIGWDDTLPKDLEAS